MAPDTGYRSPRIDDAGRRRSDRGGSDVTYRVTAEWDPTGWWTVTVPDVPGAITQCERLDQVAEDAAEVIQIQTGEAVDPVTLDVRRAARH